MGWCAGDQKTKDVGCPGGERRDEVLFIGARKLGCIVDPAMEENLKSARHRTCLMGYKQTLSPQTEGCTL